MSEVARSAADLAGLAFNPVPSGRILGYARVSTDGQQREARARRDRGESLSNIARSFNVHRATIARL